MCVNSYKDIQKLLSIISGCTNKDLDTFNEEKELLTNEVLELKKLISEKDEKISRLEKSNSDNRAKLRKLTESLDMVRASAYYRLENYNDGFYNLQNITKGRVYSEEEKVAYY